MSFLSTQNSELSSNLTRQHCLTPSTWEGDSRWAEWLTKLNGSLFKSLTHTFSKVSHAHTHTCTYSFYIAEVQESITPSSQHIISFTYSPHPEERDREGGERRRERRAHVKWKSDLFAEYFAAVADRGVYGPRFFSRLALRQAVFFQCKGGLKSLLSFLLTLLLDPEHSDSLYPPQWKMRVSTQPESKTNDYCTHETHTQAHRQNTAWWLLQDWMSKGDLERALCSFS